jgi:hypothetical protein
MRNAGECNAGECNAGERNAGERNAGERNAGERESVSDKNRKVTKWLLLCWHISVALSVK